MIPRYITKLAASELRTLIRLMESQIKAVENKYIQPRSRVRSQGELVNSEIQATSVVNSSGYILADDDDAVIEQYSTIKYYLELALRKKEEAPE